MIPLYDARFSPEPSKASEAEAALLDREVLPAVRQAFKDCQGKISVVDVASGAFTQVKSRQKAFLYRYCETGHNFANNGIAIVEGGHVVAHVVYQGGWDNAIGTLQDIDGDGLAEILMAGGSTNQGYTQGWVNLIELEPKGLQKLGSFAVYDDDCGSTGKAHKATASKLSAKRGPRPVLYLETFSSSDCGETWQKKGAPQPVAPGKDEIAYRRLK